MSLQAGDTVKFLATVNDQDGSAVDLSSLSPLTNDLLIRFEINGVTYEKQAQFESDGTDGQVYYVATGGEAFMASPGILRWHPYAKLSATQIFHGSPVRKVEIDPNISEPPA